MFELIVTFTLYLLIIIIFVMYSKFRTKNMGDYILGGRQLGSGITALGAGASDMSSWLLLALPGTVLLNGFNQIWLIIGLSLGQYLNWQLVAKRLRIYTEIANNSITIPAYLENRFQDNSHILRLFTAMAILIFFTFYAASGFVAGGILFQHVLQISYLNGLLFTSIVVIGYTLIGGFFAISWIDFFQGMLMLIALIIVPVVLMNNLGGWEKIEHSLNNNYLNVFQEQSWISILSLIGWGLGYFGQPHIIVRFMAIKHHKQTPTAQMICMTWMIISLYGAFFTGIIANVFFKTHPLNSSESAFIEIAVTIFNPWMSGILLAAILSATMSTSSAQLLGSSSAISEDLYHAFVNKNASEKKLLYISRFCVLIISIVALILALNPENSILNLVSYAWAGLGSSIGPVIIFSLFWHRLNIYGAISGIITGSVVVLIWPYFYNLSNIFHLYTIVPGFIISSISIILVSLLTKKPAKNILHDFATMKSKLND